jgi:hypothetical protein
MLHLPYYFTARRDAFAASFRKVHSIGASVAWGRLALRQALLLQFVDQVNHRGLVNLQNLDQLLLAQSATCEQQSEYSKVPHSQM